jgi:hypothetical protein
MKTFYNDEDGFTLGDMIAIIVMGTWFVVTVLIVVLVLTGTIKLTRLVIDFYDSFLNVPIGVIVGLYGQRAISGVITKFSRVRNAGEENSPQRTDDAQTTI